MTYQRPKLRGGWTSPTLYPLGQIPNSVILSIASNIVYLATVAASDISGAEWGDIFAASVGGNHLNKPLGIANVTLGNTAWSAKTVKAVNPARTNRARLISGRNAPVFSFGNDDPFTDVQETGSQVLQIWNARVEEAAQEYPHLRTVVLVRDMERFRFKIFEQQTGAFDPAEYKWTLNRRKNLEGRSVHNGLHTFTWQPHGAQLTIIRQVAASARSFQIKKPDALDPAAILASLGYSDSWVDFH